MPTCLGHPIKAQSHPALLRRKFPCWDEVVYAGWIGVVMGYFHASEISPPDLTAFGFGGLISSVDLSARRTFGQPKVRPDFRPAASAGRKSAVIRQPSLY